MTTALIRSEILYAWKGPSLLIVNTRGECGADQPLSGFYFREARFLSTLRLEINGEAPWLCEAGSPEPDALAFAFVHPEIKSPGGGGTGHSGDDVPTDGAGIPERAIDIRLSYAVGVAHLDVVLIATNRARNPVGFEVSWILGADFADIQEAQARRREQEAPVVAEVRDTLVQFSYQHPDLPFRSEVRHDGQLRVSGDRAATRLTLDVQESATVRLRIVPSTLRADIAPQGEDEREEAVRRWREDFARVDVPGNRLFERVLASAVRDIASFPLLEGEADEWLAMQAGMPLYPAFFGRDAVTAGWQAGYLDRGAALDAALTKLARMQSNRLDDWRDEEPGRIPYQMRNGPLALLNINPYSAYYADQASPLMFVISLANLWAWTGDRRQVAGHWDAARRILDWARKYGDLDGDGYLEYQTRSAKGTKNQGWKDSGDAIVYEDGTPVPSPIATCELQAYWYIAQELAAVLSGIMGARDDAAAHAASASALKERFNRDWWIEEDGFYALALDPDKRRVRAASSNVGHCLACGIIERERLPAVVGRLFAPDMFSGWGIRTLSADHPYYNPISYHRGTMWAVEQATIVFGLRRFGFDARAFDLAGALFDLALLYPEYRIPECVGGYARGDRATPGAYPRANTPQLWNCTAFPLVVQTLLGLVPLAASEVLLVDPSLPTWLPEVVLRNLRVGSAKISLRFWRDKDGRSDWEVLHTQGTLRVIRQPAPESLSATLADRARSVLESLTR